MHHVTKQIALQYLKPRGKMYHTAYRMHEAGFQNMLEDAQTLHEREPLEHWKILLEDVQSGAVLATLASGKPGTVSNLSPIVRAAFTTELTPAGEQHVIPGCERNNSPRATQLDLFG